jgi:phenylacetate-CoA ligase
MAAIVESDGYRVLHAMLRQASVYSPYYRDQAWAARLRGEAEIRLRDDIGVTPKSAVRDHSARFYADVIPPEDGKTIDKYTSGSTGEPMLIKKTMRHFQINAQENVRLNQGWRAGEHRKVVAVKSAREGTPFGSVEEKAEKGRTCWTLLGLDAERGLALLIANQATMLHCYPSIAHEVLKLAAEGGEKLAVQLVSTVGEVLTDDFRELARERFNCRILDIYGTIESGIIAGRCAHCDHYHPADRHLIFEVLRDDGSPARPGDIGRVVVTPLFNAAMPLLRYETGDFVELAESNNCPRSTVAVRRILGRERNMFTLPGGRKITPMVPARLAIELGLKQFKLVQTTQEDVEFRYVLSDGGAPLPVDRAQAIIDTYLSPRLRARPLAVAEIPRSRSGKYLMHESLVN